MITDEERRNVAANIRSAAERAKDDLNDDSNYSKLAVLYVVSCAVRGVPHYKDLLHLADLIDRPTCRNNGNHNDRHFWCSACGYEAWTYDDSGCDPSNFSFCPECGAVVIDED